MSNLLKALKEVLSLIKQRYCVKFIISIATNVAAILVLACFIQSKRIYYYIFSILAISLFIVFFDAYLFQWCFVNTRRIYREKQQAQVEAGRVVPPVPYPPSHVDHWQDAPPSYQEACAQKK